VEALDLAGGGGRTGLGEQVLHTVLPTDPVEEHLNRRMVEPPGEDPPVVGEDLLGDPVAPHRQGKGVTDRPGALPGHQQRRDAVPGVVIDPGQRLGVRAVGQQEPTDDVHLPKLHRPPTLPPTPLLPPPVPRLGIDQAGAHQRPVHRRC